MSPDYLPFVFENTTPRNLGDGYVQVFRLLLPATPSQELEARFGRPSDIGAAGFMHHVGELTLFYLSRDKRRASLSHKGLEGTELESLWAQISLLTGLDTREVLGEDWSATISLAELGRTEDEALRPSAAPR